MSHTMNIKLEMLDRDAIFAAAERLGLKISEGNFNFYSGTADGIGVILPGWRFPAVIKKDGSVSFDNYNGTWGAIEKLHEFTAYYGLEKSKAEARKKGYSIIEGINEETKELELQICVEA